jgi:hypothetical protein
MLPATRPLAVPQCKGSLLLNLQLHVESRQGALGWRNLVESMSDSDRHVLDGLVLVGGWYPIGVWNRVLKQYLSQLPSPSQEMAEIARFVADRDLNSLYKALLRMGSPSFVLQRSDALWRRYFDVGDFGYHEVDRHEYRLTLEAPADPESGPDVWTCNEGVSNWLTHALHLTGAKQGKVTHVRCRFAGASRCEYQARW